MITPKFPPNIHIEICNFCNARCTICPVSSMKRKPEVMDFELFSKIICELETIDFKGQIFPFLNGEVLLVPNIISYLSLIREKLPKATVTLYSNGSRLNPELSKIIIKNNLLDFLVISFDGGTKEAYESIRQGLSFDEVRKNVHYFLEIRNELKAIKPKVIIVMVITPENYHTMEVLKREFKDADKVKFSLLFNWGGWMKSKIPINKYLLGRSNYCVRLYKYIHILSNGDVSLCCFDYEGKEILGNVRYSSIQDIWLGEEFQKRRNYLRRRMFSRLPLCKNCDVINQNLIIQQLVKVTALIESIFPNSPNFIEYIIDLYKALIFRIKK